VVEARNFVDQLEQLIPGQGTKAIRGILQALADTPQLQRAFFGGPVIEIAPIGVFEQDGPKRYEDAIRTRSWEEFEQGKAPGIRDAAYRPERDGVPQPIPLPDKFRTPEEEARLMRPLAAHAGTEALATNDGLLDPRNWPDSYRTQALSSQGEAIKSEATVSNVEDGEAHAIQIAQAQPQQQPPPRQG
jgi:hypothetical protein